YKTHKGYNVLHPMGYDAFGLPAEQYAIQTGQHPAITTNENIKRYREQLDKIGFSYDWSRHVKTCDPDYYKWTQWAFLQMFHHWYSHKTNKAEHIDKLVAEFEANGTHNIDAACTETIHFTAEQWKAFPSDEKQKVLLNYRLAYLAETMVNWCPELGTVLANDEVINGVSERGGYPVVQKKMQQWSLRISAYAQRLLDGLDTLNWSDSLKEMQRNWIGRSEGADVLFKVKDSDQEMLIFTTRPDTIFGCTFMVLAPESELVEVLTCKEQHEKVLHYCNETKKRSERERIADVKKVTGVFTGSYAVNPFTKEEIPVYVSDYVLAGYGTGAIMAVPAHDSRDYAFAKHFNLPIIPVIQPIDGEIPEGESYDTKEGVMINSGFITGMKVKDAIKRAIDEVENKNIGSRKVNFRLRDAIFSRQRYWGEPFPVYFKDGLPYPVDESKLPLELPEVDKFLPTEDGQPPLGRAKNWKTEEGYSYELSTMPGFAGSSAYYLRYMDPKNSNELVAKDVNEYWQDVDLYIGGTEHATGHLIYSRFWNKFLFDMGIVCKDEPFNKLINQGMIQGKSSLVFRIRDTNTFVSAEKVKDYDVVPLHVDINLVENDVLDIEAFKKWRPEFENAEFICEEGRYLCGSEVEKMSKRYHNVVNPDDIVEKYGADTLRMYEMFLGPLELSKPWDTNGIDGVFKFLRKFLRLFTGTGDTLSVTVDAPVKEELKVLHKTIKKISSDIENFSFNTSVSAFMICVNELNDLSCNKRNILEPLVVLISPFAPHIAEELWNLLGNEGSVTKASWPQYDEKVLVEDSYEYPVSFNGKMRFKKVFSLEMAKDDIEKDVLSDERALKWLDGKQPKKVIIVPKKIINIVV
ncbi:MAG: leucine--tRNA ligase, partial [Marinilabiliales bacterium]